MVGIYNVIVMIFYHYILLYIHVYIFTNNTTHGFTKIQERSEAQLSKNIYIYIYGDKVLDIPPTPRKLCPT